MTFERRVSILIVEDSITQREELRYHLEKAGHKAIPFRNGSLAWEWLQKALPEELPAIIITDIVMPEMDGYELCKKIKEEKKTHSIPVILLTSLSDPLDVIKGLEAGADNFITKPYEPEFLLSRIDHILINQEIRQSGRSEMGLEVFFAGKRHYLSSNRLQMIDLLLSTYENAIQKNIKLKEANEELLATQRLLEKKNQELLQTQKELEKRNQELLETQKILEEQNQKLSELNEMKSTLLGMAAHDLRTPLASILGYSKFLEISPELGEKKKKFVEAIKRNSEFMLHLVEDLLDLSLIESGRLDLKLQKENLNETIEEVLDLEREIAERKNIKITFQPSTSLPPIYIDKNRIRQVISNLISNGVKYSEEGTEITVTVQQEGEYIKLAVQDQGQGIPSEEIERLFQPFQKTSVQATKGEKSTGLGLAIVKKIVEAHGGRIWVESEVGKGSTFYMSLPLKNVQVA
ncbi:MAG: hybrid sensor histidine kinase/response regulator [Planctomycetota bacterium]|nr:MAG: hybrid sensor histidine kinase/response regulator [Planctomycetota bacterium]